MVFPWNTCVREIENTCKDKRYRILRGMSETRLRDAPPYSTEYRTSRIEFVCSDDGGQMVTASVGESVWNCGDERLRCGRYSRLHWYRRVRRRASLSARWDRISVPVTGVEGPGRCRPRPYDERRRSSSAPPNAPRSTGRRSGNRGRSALVR